MPQYKKAFDIGTYTGNGGVYRIGMPTLRGVGPGGKQVANSLRFRSGQYLLKSSDGGGYTSLSSFSFWVKRSKLGSTQMIYSGGQASNSYGYIAFNSSDQIQVTDIGNGSTTTSVATILAVRDTAQWYHICVIIDAAQATSTNRVKIYVNGINQPLSGTYPSQGYGYNLLYIGDKYIGAQGSTGQGPSNYFDGYLAHFYKPDFGVAYDYTYYAEFNSDGILVPKTFSGTLSSAAFYLQFAAGGIGADSSGYNNNFTPTGFNTTTANSSYDIMTDSPTDYLSGSMTTANNAGNYCTINPVDTYATAGSWSVTNAGLYLTSSATLGSVRGTLGFSSGKWYWEVKYITGNVSELAGISTPTSTSAGGSAGGIGYYTNGNIYVNGSASAYGTSVSAGDIIGVAVDMDNGKIWFSRNGTWQNSGDPAAGTNPGTTGLSGTYYPGFEDGASGYNGAFEANFGQRPFSYTPPTGFKSLNTYNLNRPADSSLWFYGDIPDLMWIKNRSRASSHVIQDTVRGIGLNMFADLTNAESSYPYVMEMSKFGMSVQYGTGANYSGDNFVYYGWKAGSNTSSSFVTNNNGNVTTQVSANPATGFSIVTYTGTGAVSSGVTLGHGLGATPAFIITKKRSSGTTDYGWSTWHTSLGGNYGIWLNSTAARNPGMWAGYSSFSSTVFTPPDKDYGNVSGETYVNYLWTAIPGYSSFGSYSGNGSTDGPFVYLGFRPKWILIRSYNGATARDWLLYDAVRGVYNPQAEGPLQPNVAGTPYGGGYTGVDFLSNGFKIRESTTNLNNSSESHIYAAFAETPFKFARAR